MTKFNKKFECSPNCNICRMCFFVGGALLVISVITFLSFLI